MVTKESKIKNAPGVNLKMVSVGDLGNIFKGKGISKAEVTESGLPCVRYGELYTRYHFHFSETVSFCNKESAQQSQKIQKGDILFAGSGETAEEIGKCAVYLGEKEAYAGGDIIILRPEKCDSLFLAYVLNSEYVIKQKSVLGQGNAVVHIYPKDIATLKVKIPELSVQRKIAKILSTWDVAIGTLENLTKQKKKYKRVVMRMLLTGEKRFKKLRKEKWEYVKFGEIFEFLPNLSLSREQLTSESLQNPIYNIHYGDIHATYKGDVLDFEVERGVPKIKNAAKPKTEHFLRDGDLIIADVSEDYEGVASCIELVNVKNRKVTGGLHTFVARDCSGKTTPGFRTYILKNTEVAKKIKQIATGSKVYGITKRNLREIEVLLPTGKEQKMIAQILKLLDAEIQGLLQQRLIYIKQKEGLMQKLLNGKVRVKV